MTFFLDLFLFVCVFVLVYISVAVCMAYVYGCLWRSGEGVKCPRTRVTGCLMWLLDPNPSPLEEQYALLTTQSSISLGCKSSRAQ